MSRIISGEDKGVLDVISEALDEEIHWRGRMGRYDALTLDEFLIDVAWDDDKERFVRVRSPDFRHDHRGRVPSDHAASTVVVLLGDLRALYSRLPPTS